MTKRDDENEELVKRCRVWADAKPNTVVEPIEPLLRAVADALSRQPSVEDAELVKSVAEVRRVAGIVRETQPKWCVHLMKVCNAASRLSTLSKTQARVSEEALNEIYELLHECEAQGFDIPPPLDQWWQRKTDEMMLLNGKGEG